MIGIDTKVLVRIIVKDDDIQAQKALRFVKKHGEVFVSSVVLCETAWVLESCYSLNKKDMIQVFEHILKISQFTIEHSEATWLALDQFKQLNADFSDCLIASIATLTGCDSIGTFDKKAAKINNFTLIK